MRIILCEYKNGLYGEIISYSAKDGNGNMTTIPFKDFSLQLKHNLNGICTNIQMDRIYRTTFNYAVEDISINNLDDFEITKLLILKSQIVCKLAEEGTKDKLINVDKISTENKNIIREYLKYKNITLKDIFNNFKYNTSLYNILEGD